MIILSAVRMIFVGFMCFNFRCLVLKLSFFLVFQISGVVDLFSSNQNISADSFKWADSVYINLSIEERVALLFAVDVRNDDNLNKVLKSGFQPAFILGSPKIASRRWPKNITFPGPVIIPDLSNGYDSGISQLPFPNEATVAFMDSVNRKNLLIHLYNWMRINKYPAFFARESYTMQSDYNISWFHTIQLPAINTNSFQTKGPELKVHNIPKNLLKMAPSLRLPDFGKFTGGKRFNEPYFSTIASSLGESVEAMLEGKCVLLTDNYEVDYNRVLTAFKDRWLEMELLENACKYILAFKYEMHLQSLKQLFVNPKSNLETDLRKGYESAIGVYQATDQFPFPFVFLDFNIGFLTDGTGHFDDFREMAANYIQTGNTLLEPQDYKAIFWLVGPDFDMSLSLTERIMDIRSRFPRAILIMVRAGDLSGLSLRQLPSGVDAMVVTSANLPISWSAMAQVIFNGIAVNRKGLSPTAFGSLSKVSKSFPATRLKFGIPEEVGMNRDTLNLIHAIMDDAIRKSAFPGGQVLVAKNGVVVFNRNYGYTTYEKTRPVTNDVVYDLASVTKVTATLPVLMQQYDNGRWRLSDKLSEFIPQADSTNKKDITVRQLLLHESGLPAFISFYTEAIDRSKLVGNLFSNRRSATHPLKLDARLYMNKTAVFRDNIFRPQADLDFSVPVAQNLFMNVYYLDSMLVRMLKAKVDANPKYRYSDINFLLLQKISENLAQESLDQVASSQFYKPLGANNLGYNPWRTIPLERIAPTENDLVFRKQLLHGYVHDQGAAMMGGVAGHAGLFGNATDLAKLLQMYLNKGVYGGYRYLQPETVDFFSSRQNSNSRRGLGFDKPDIDNASSSTPAYSKMASPSSYGHTGFSGTIIWVDPAYDLIYIFLSNRIHPYSYNNKIMELRVRPRIHNIVYRSIVPSVKASK